MEFHKGFRSDVCSLLSVVCVFRLHPPDGQRRLLETGRKRYGSEIEIGRL